MIVENKLTLCFQLTCSAFKKGISVPLGKAVHPNNGLRSFEIDEAVRLAINYDILFVNKIQHVVTILQAHTSACVNTEKEKKLVFLTRLSELSSQKQFFMNYYCFSLESYTNYGYKQLRDILVLPNKCKLRYITSFVDKDQVLWKTFAKSRYCSRRMQSFSRPL